MQSPSIQDFPLNSKRRLELQNQHISQLQQLQQLQQQQNCDDMICDNEGPPFKKQRPGVATNFLYKFAEFAAYTSAFATEAINTITGGHVGNEQYSIRRNYDDDYEEDDVLQIKTDDEDEEEDLCVQNLDKKDESSTWVENVEEEEPPPPYDSSWSMPSPSTSNDKMPAMITTPALSSSPSQQEFATSQKPSNLQQTVTKSITRRRQFRVRRGRRFSRRRSSSTDMSSNANNNNNTSSGQPGGDEEDIFLKFNCKLTDMIAEGKAALTSKVNVTDVEIMLAEEKEREERIMKELGIQTPINRRARRLTGSSSTSSDYSSLFGSGGYSNQSNSLYDSGFSGGSNCYSSPTGSYSVDNGFVTNRPVIGHSSPTQYGSSGFNSPVGHGFGSPSTFSSTTPAAGGGYEMFNNFGQNSSKYGSGSGFGSNGMYNGRSYF